MENSPVVKHSTQTCLVSKGQLFHDIVVMSCPDFCKNFSILLPFLQMKIFFNERKTAEVCIKCQLFVDRKESLISFITYHVNYKFKPTTGSGRR